MIQNVSPQNPVWLVDDKKPPAESQPQKNETEMDSNGGASRAVKTHQFVSLRPIDLDLELVHALLREQRHVGPGIQQHQDIRPNSAGCWIPRLDPAHGRWRTEP